MMRLAVDDSPWNAARRRPWRAGILPRLILHGLILGTGASCALDAPPGEPTDFGALPRFNPFELRTLDGEPKVLADFLERVTLISFFFPT